MLKKIARYSLLLFVLAITALVISVYPLSSDAQNFTRLSDTTRIKNDFDKITNTAKSRNYINVETLDSVAEYIKTEFLKNTARVEEQVFTVDEQEYKNIIASFGPEGGERIIVGAHYDVCKEQVGADDNASGTIGLLELARLLMDSALKYRIDLVAYTLEEPPFFRTQFMGSAVHAQMLVDKKIAVKGMICLEMIGYFSDTENSQNYPLGFLKWFYGNKGNFITVVQKFNNGKFPRQFKRLMFQNNSIDTKSFKSPSYFPGVDFSDHLNYWDRDFPAVMITNTAFYRNKNYHTTGDTVATIDMPKMALVIDGVYRTLLAIK